EVPELEREVGERDEGDPAPAAPPGRLGGEDVGAAGRTGPVDGWDLGHDAAIPPPRYAGRSPPPCRSREAPLMEAASGEARNRQASATSPGVTSRPSGTVPAAAAGPPASR